MAEKMKQYYVQGESIGLEEDEAHEFKGHRFIAYDDLLHPKLTKSSSDASKQRTRQAVSRCMCAFLNSGKGGDVFMGVSDEGMPLLMMLSKYQMDHLLLGIDRTFERFVPPVPNHLWHVTFMPVVSSKSEGQERLREVVEWRNVDRQDLKRLSPHRFPASNRCWCELSKETDIRRAYVVKVHIESTMRSPENGSFYMPTIYQCDGGNVFFRNNASTVRYTPEEIIRHTQNAVARFYKPIVDELREKIDSIVH